MGRTASTVVDAGEGGRNVVNSYPLNIVCIVCAADSILCRYAVVMRVPNLRLRNQVMIRS